MSALWDTPYSLAAGTIITAKVLAHNARGWGAESSANVGPTPIVETAPEVMADITRGILTSNDKIQIDWVALSSPNNGESVITSYNLYFD